MSRHARLPAEARLFELYTLNPETGALHHKKKFGVKEGSAAGNVMPSGYLRVKADGRLYLAHRIVYAMYYGEDPGHMEVDHINGDKSDNRPSNLRLATREQNRQNVSAYSSNRHGARGVWFDGRRNAYFCAVQAFGCREQFGPFDDLKKASSVYEAEARARFGEFYMEAQS